MRNIKNMVLKLTTVMTLVYAVSGCNSGGTTNNGAPMSLQNYMSQLNYVSTTGGSRRNKFQSISSESQLSMIFPVATNLNQMKVDFYSSTDCSGTPVVTDNYPGGYIQNSGIVTKTDNSNYLDCSVDNLCTIESSTVYSMRFTFLYTLADNSTSGVTRCLMNSGINPIINESGEFTANYNSHNQCTTGDCGFSVEHVMNIYSQNSITESVSFSGTGSVVAPGKSFAMTINLNGVPGVESQNLSVVALNAGGLPAGPTITVSPSTCVLQSTTAPYNTNCSINIATTIGAAAGNYTLSVTNQSGNTIIPTESSIPFTVSASGTFTVTNSSFLESIVLTPATSPFIGDWTCDGVNVDPASYTIPPNTAVTCNATTNDDNQMHQGWLVGGYVSSTMGSFNYSCNVDGSYHCNSTMTATSFVANNDNLGFMIGVNPANNSIAYNSPSCPTGADFAKLSPGPLFAYDNYESWVFSSVPVVGTTYTFTQAKLQIGLNATVLSCHYSSANGDTYMQANINPQDPLMRTMNYYAPNWPIGGTGQRLCTGSPVNPYACQFTF